MKENERLTLKRVNGIKHGYWSPAKKDELIERLAAYENTGLSPEEIIDLWKIFMGGAESNETP